MSVGIFGKTQFEALDYRMHVSIILGILDLIAMKAYGHQNIKSRGFENFIFDLNVPRIKSNW